MAVRFVIGRAGVGKSQLLHDRLVEHLLQNPLTQRAFVLVPKQATFQTQRRIARDPRLNGFCRVHVIAPDDLGELILVETGHSTGARLDATGRSLLLGHLLRVHEADLEHFGASAGERGLASEIDAAFMEFEHAGRDLTEIDTLIADASTGDAREQTLARKLRDLKMLYAHYQQFLADHHFDPYRRQLLVPEMIRRSDEVKRSLVIVDDFFDFAAYERSLIAALGATAQETLIALPMDTRSPLLKDPNLLPAELGLFRRTEQAYRALWFDLKKANAVVNAPTLLKEPKRFERESLRSIESQFELLAPRPKAKTEGVHFVCCADPADEVDSAARRIKSAITGKYRLRDVCVLARSIGNYAPLIESSFREHGIGFFLDRRRSALHHPLVRTVQAILQIVQTRWANDAVFDLVSAGLTDLEDGQLDLLQDYVSTHLISGSAWRTDAAWTLHRTQYGEEKHSRFSAGELKQVRDGRAHIIDAMAGVGSPAWADTPMAMSKLSSDLFGVLTRLKTQSRMLALIGSTEDPERREEHELVWNRVVELTDRLCDLLGEIQMTGERFAEVLQTALGELELAITPPTVDQVLVGSIDRTRVDNARIVIVLGLNASEFPLCDHEQTVLNDTDRRYLLSKNVEVSAARRDALLDERFLGYIGLTRASDHIVLMRTERDAKGNELEASPFWTHAIRSLSNPTIERTTEALDRIATPRQAITHLLTWSRRVADLKADADQVSLYNWLIATRDESVTKVRDRAWSSLSYRNEAALSPAIAKRLFASPLEASVSRFESYASCAFQHFVRYGLRLQAPVEEDITALDLGSLYHSVLDRLVKDAIEAKVDFAGAHTLSAEQIRAVALEIGESLREQIFLSSARSRYTLQQLENAVYKLIRAQQYLLQHGDFRPAYTELAFGNAGDLPPLQLTTPGGGQVRLSGKIDRVDIDEVRKLFTVIDYKLNGDQLSLPYVAHGLMLQLLTYLLVLQKNGDKLARQPLTPAAAFYVRVLRSLESVPHPRDADDESTDAFLTKTKPRGLIDAGQAAYIDRTIAATNKSELISIRIKADGDLAASAQDAVETGTFTALVAFVEEQLVQIADRIFAGDIAVAPYVIARETPCAHCDLQRICRFDRSINSYRPLASHDRKSALELITGVKQSGGGDET